MNQPVWGCIGSIGDKDLVRHGGGLVMADIRELNEPEEGVPRHRQEVRYCQELWYIKPPTDDMKDPESEEGYKAGAVWHVYTVILERMKEVSKARVIYLVAAHYQPDYPLSVSTYQGWFVKHLHSVCDHHGVDEKDLRDYLMSEDPMKRAQAYMAIGDTLGFGNFDEYPRTRDEQGIKDLVARYLNPGKG